jgi:hypothetical protein
VTSEGAAERTGHKVLMEIDDNILLIVGDPQGILDLQVSPHSIQLLNIVMIFIN